LDTFASFNILKRASIVKHSSLFFYVINYVLIVLYIQEVAGFNHVISIILNYPNSHERNHSSDTAKAHANHDHSFSAHATLACSERVAED
jgi:hypothetical protein